MPRVLLYEKVPQAWFDGFAAFLRERQPEGLSLELVQPQGDDVDHMLELLPETDVLIVGLTGQHRAVVRKVFEEGVRLKLVQKLGSRLTGLDLDAARDVGVPVCLLPAPAHIACAEHTLLLLLAVARKLPAASRLARGEGQRPGARGAKSRKDVERGASGAEKGDPAAAAPSTVPPPSFARPDYDYNWAEMAGIGVLAGKTLGLIGMADIGIEVAYRAKAFGMKVVYYQEEALPQDEQELLDVAYCDLEPLLRQADVVSLHAGLGGQTQGLLNAERLGLMKPSAILLNTARGGLVDESALATALRDGRLAGAGIDAWAAEPTPRDNPLLKLDNVVATPHVAAGTMPPSATYDVLLPNLLAALRGDPLAGMVSPPRATRASGADLIPPEERASSDEPTPADDEPNPPTLLADHPPEGSAPSGG